MFGPRFRVHKFECCNPLAEEEKFVRFNFFQYDCL